MFPFFRLFAAGFLRWASRLKGDNWFLSFWNSDFPDMAENIPFWSLQRKRRMMRTVNRLFCYVLLLVEDNSMHTIYLSFLFIWVALLEAFHRRRNNVSHLRLFLWKVCCEVHFLPKKNIIHSLPDLIFFSKRSIFSSDSSNYHLYCLRKGTLGKPNSDPMQFPSTKYTWPSKKQIKIRAFKHQLFG